jgi:hypothetical protein
VIDGAWVTTPLEGRLQADNMITMMMNMDEIRSVCDFISLSLKALSINYYAYYDVNYTIVVPRFLLFAIKRYNISRRAVR